MTWRNHWNTWKWHESIVWIMDRSARAFCMLCHNLIVSSFCPSVLTAWTRYPLPPSRNTRTSNKTGWCFILRLP
uniref:NEK5 n=1 Tax=Arundo donax TaxID=35708 RepID=A0A0A9HFP5_ARUDO